MSTILRTTLAHVSSRSARSLTSEFSSLVSSIAVDVVGGRGNGLGGWCDADGHGGRRDVFKVSRSPVGVQRSRAKQRLQRAPSVSSRLYRRYARAGIWDDGQLWRDTRGVRILSCLWRGGQGAVEFAPGDRQCASHQV